MLKILYQARYLPCLTLETPSPLCISVRISDRTSGSGNNRITNIEKYWSHWDAKNATSSAVPSRKLVQPSLTALARTGGVLSLLSSSRISREGKWRPFEFLCFMLQLEALDCQSFRNRMRQHGRGPKKINKNTVAAKSNNVWEVTLQTEFGTKT